MQAKTKWSNKHSKCIECGLVKWKHQAKGLCRRCYKRVYRKTPSGKAERKRYWQKWYEKPSNKLKIKNYDYIYKYGIGLKEKEALLNEQKWKCLICGVNAGSKLSDWHLDHCHVTKKVRGILCSPCNRGLGCFKDNIIFLKKAIKYLKS